MLFNNIALLQTPTHFIHQKEWWGIGDVYYWEDWGQFLIAEGLPDVT